jgi:hypothetical protein
MGLDWGMSGVLCWESFWVVMTFVFFLSFSLFDGEVCTSLEMG